MFTINFSNSPFFLQNALIKASFAKPHLFMDATLSSGPSECCCSLPMWPRASTERGTAKRHTGGRAKAWAQNNLLRCMCMKGIRLYCLLTVNQHVFSFLAVESFLLFSNYLHNRSLAAGRRHVFVLKLMWPLNYLTLKSTNRRKEYVYVPSAKSFTYFGWSDSYLRKVRSLPKPGCSVTASPESEHHRASPSITEHHRAILGSTLHETSNPQKTAASSQMLILSFSSYEVNSATKTIFPVKASKLILF